MVFNNVKKTDYPLLYHYHHGPSFNQDLRLKGLKESENLNDNYCRKNSYEKTIKNIEDNFSIEDYEVFQILKK